MRFYKSYEYIYVIQGLLLKLKWNININEFCEVEGEELLNSVIQVSKDFSLF